MSPTEMHRCEHFLVVHKQPGWPTTSADPHADSVHRWLRQHEPQGASLHPCSRLDLPVSGVLLFARTRAARQQVMRWRRAGAYRRHYVAVAAGSACPQPTGTRTPAAGTISSRSTGTVPQPTSVPQLTSTVTQRACRPCSGPTPGGDAFRRGRWSWPIGIAPHNRRLRVAVSDSPLPNPVLSNPVLRASRARTPQGIKPATTDYIELGRAAAACVLLLTPQTGRTHQLRVHCAAAGLPIWGDAAYGGPKRFTADDGRVHRAARLMLHAHVLTLPASPLGPARQWIAEVPTSFVDFWSALGGPRWPEFPAPLVL